jgi:hypothetical protein
VLGVEIPAIGKFRDCTPRIDCSANQKCEKVVVGRDARDCRKCLGKSPFGGCIARISDPVCEAAKASRNAALSAEAAARTLDCQRLQVQTIQACEANKASIVAACESQRSAEVQASRKLIEQYQVIKVLSSKYRSYAVPAEVEAVVTSMTGKLPAPMLFLRSAPDTLTYRLWALIDANRYVPTSEVPETVISGEAHMRSADTTHVIAVERDIVVEDIVRAGVVSTFFSSLGRDGVAQIQAAGSLDLAVAVDSQAAAVCDSLHKSSAKVTCDQRVTLRPRASPP